MKVILLQSIKNFGQIGDIKNVSDGYGKNFLIPKGMAKLATDNSVKEAESLKKKAEITKIVEKEKALEAAEKMKDTVLEFTKKASKTGRLFSSVTKKEIADQASRASGFLIDEDMVDLGEHGEHIKQTGEHITSLGLSPETRTTIKIKVIGN